MKDLDLLRRTYVRQRRLKFGSSKIGLIAGTSLVDNQQPSSPRNRLEGSTTKTYLPERKMKSVGASAPKRPTPKGEDIVWSA